MGRLTALGLALALGVCATGAAQATLIGGPVPDTAFGGATIYNYQGSSVSAFTVAGGGTLQLTVASFGDTVGTSRTDQSGQAVIFDNSFSIVGATATITPGYSPFLFFFKTVGTNQMANCDPSNGSECAATLFSNGLTLGAAGGNDGGQTNLAIYYATTTNTYAMFFDDGGNFGLVGGMPVDDNDYNDLVVTFTPNVGTPTAVPEPASIALLGLGLVGVSLSRRLKSI